MRRAAFWIAVAAVGWVCLAAGCTSAQKSAALATPAGALFCAVQVHGGGWLVVNLVDTAASSAVGGVEPVVVLAAGAAKAQVDADCAAAGKSMGGSGVAVSPPPATTAVPQVAIVVPTP